MAHEIDITFWTPSFQRLAKIFFQINTHLTFLSTHSRTTIPTIDLVQTLNGTITKLDLTIIKALLPQGDVLYEYVDENQIMLSFAEPVKFDWNTGYQQSKTSVDDAFDLSRKEDSESNQLLVFDFRDAKMHGIGAIMKGQKRRKVENSKSSREQDFFLSSKELSVTPVTPTQLMQMIKSRNQKFLRCVETYLSEFSKEEIEADIPMTQLVKKETANIPEPPELNDPVDALDQVTTTHDFSDKPDLETMVDTLQTKPFYKHQIFDMRVLTPSQQAITKKLPDDGGLIIHPELRDALMAYKNISIDEGLYSHQTEALEVLMFDQTKRHVIISTSTSSGKSLVYQLPIINDILWNISRGIRKRATTAFFIFPTKALAQDQKRHLQDFINYLPSNNDRKIIVDTYDGDTPGNARNSIRSFADIIFTNPDAIHASILPNHEGYDLGAPGWHDFLSSLKYVVVDELHVYKGTFGIHVSYVMTRLLRITSKITSVRGGLRFVSCSATILNPESHFRSVCAIPRNEDVVHISLDGSPCSEKKLVIWSPPPLMNKKGYQPTIETVDGIETSNQSRFVPRENMIPELAKVLLHLLENLPTVKAIVFCPIRVVCELLMKEIRILLQDSSRKFNNVKESDIMSYRGGYSKSDRRIIEQRMFSGQLRGIVATNALELGIDLADLDIVITCGFPMLKANLHQQFGRAGRGKKSSGSLAIFVAGASPVDQYYMRNGDDLCDKDTYEDLCVEGLIEMGCNQLIMEMHLQCAAFEEPIDLAVDVDWFAPDKSSIKANTFTKLCRQRLYKDANEKYRTNPKYLPWPAEHVSIRNVEETKFAVVDITNNRNIVIEEVEALRTSFTLYEGGIFLHQGFPYLVKEFNPDDRYAKVERVKVDWITQQRDFTDMDPQEIEYVKQLHPPNLASPTDIPVFFGSIKTTIVVFGFFKVNRRAEILEAVEVNNPPVVMLSKGFWIDILNEVLEVIKEKSLSPAGGIHAAQHAIMSILPLFINGGATTNPNARFTSNLGDSELKTECKAPEKEFAQRQSNRKRPGRLIFHDSKGGENGSGFAAKTFEHIDEIIYTTYKRVSECECDWGCPQCVTGSFCQEGLQVISKPGAILILASLLGYNLEVVRGEVLDGPEKNMPQLKVETIEPAGAPVKFSPNVEIVSVQRATHRFSIKEEQLKVEEVEEVEEVDVEEVEEVNVEEVEEVSEGDDGTTNQRTTTIKVKTE